MLKNKNQYLNGITFKNNLSGENQTLEYGSLNGKVFEMYLIEVDGEILTRKIVFDKLWNINEAKDYWERNHEILEEET